MQYFPQHPEKPGNIQRTFPQRCSLGVRSLKSFSNINPNRVVICNFIISLWCAHVLHPSEVWPWRWQLLLCLQLSVLVEVLQKPSSTTALDSMKRHVTQSSFNGWSTENDFEYPALVFNLYQLQSISECGRFSFCYTSCCCTTVGQLFNLSLLSGGSWGRQVLHNINSAASPILTSRLLITAILKPLESNTSEWWHQDVNDALTYYENLGQWNSIWRAIKSA